MKQRIKPIMALLSPVFYDRNANIQHTHAYKFQGPDSQRKSSGLDFSKSVLISNNDEIGAPAHLIPAERKELLKRFHFIVEKFHAYIDDFIEGLNNEPLQPKYKMSSLTYYKEALLNSKK